MTADVGKKIQIAVRGVLSVLLLWRVATHADWSVAVVAGGSMLNGELLVHVIRKVKR